MRIIDADELIKSYLDHNRTEFEIKNCCMANENVIAIIDNAPTVAPDMDFAKWVTEMIFGNNEVEDFDFELFSELACRKLEKLGLVKKTESEWIKKGGVG